MVEGSIFPPKIIPSHLRSGARLVRGILFLQNGAFTKTPFCDAGRGRII